MRKTILILLLAVVNGNAAAEWANVGSNEASTVYVDPATIRREDNVAEMWYLVDFKTVQTMAGMSFFSTTTQYEYDCKKEQARTLSFSFHSGNMGGGDVVFNDSNPGKWAPILPGPIGERLRKSACGKP